MSRLGFCAVLALCVLGCWGCGKSTKKAAPVASASAKSVTAPRPPGFDAALFEDLGRLAKVCKVDVDQGNVSCAQGEQRQLIGEFVSNQRSRNNAIATLAFALREGDVPVRATAANLLNSAFRSPWGPSAVPNSVSQADADSLLTAALALPKVLARQAVPAAVHASMLAGRHDALYAAVDKSKDSELRLVATRYLLTYGRLAAFKHVQELSKEPSSAVVLAALESPRNMFNWSTDEQGALCPWAASFLDDPRPAVVAKAASVLSACSGEWVDRLLALGEKSVAAKTFTVMQLAAFRDLCAPHQAERQNGATEQQCKRSRALLEKATVSAALDEQTRSSALTSIAYQWPDEGTLKLARKLSKAKEPSLAEVARRTTERIEQRGAVSVKPGRRDTAAGGLLPAAVARPVPSAAAE